MNDIELVVFDLAGTTIQDTGQVPEAFTTVLRSHGIEVSDESLRAVRGASKREAIRHLLGQQSSGKTLDLDTRTEHVFAEFCQRLAMTYARDGVQAIPGAADTFARLHRLGIKVALNTGFDRTITELVLRVVGWDQDTVDAIVCGDDVRQGRPAPYLIFRSMEATGVISVRRVATVGDTVLDLQAGWKAAVRWNIGVLSGAHTQEQLERVAHTHLLPSVAALSSLWE